MKTNVIAGMLTPTLAVINLSRELHQFSRLRPLTPFTELCSRQSLQKHLRGSARCWQSFSWPSRLFTVIMLSPQNCSGLTLKLHVSPLSSVYLWRSKQSAFARMRKWIGLPTQMLSARRDEASCTSHISDDLQHLLRTFTDWLWWWAPPSCKKRDVSQLHKPARRSRLTALTVHLWQAPVNQPTDWGIYLTVQLQSEETFREFKTLFIKVYCIIFEWFFRLNLL